MDGFLLLANIYYSLLCSSLKLRKFSKIYIFNPRTTFNFSQLEMFVSVTGLNGCSEPQINSEVTIDLYGFFKNIESRQPIHCVI